MFEPKYTISHQLLNNITRVNSLVGELNQRRFSKVVLMELTQAARAVSTHASTSIEGNPLPLTEVKRILKAKPVHIRQSEQEVLNYNLVLKDLDEQLKASKVKMSVAMILRIQKGVMRGLLPESDWGKLRQKHVVVNDPRSREVVFLPPDAHEVPELVGELVEWVGSSRDKIDPLIVAGVFHKQMVVIHPFMDGNGRTVRLATKVLLAEMGLNTFELFSFENYYNKNVTSYFEMVGEFGDYYELKNKLDFTRWLEYFTEGIIDELWRVKKLLPEVGIGPQAELKPHDRKILEWVKDRGFIADRDYAKLVDRARATRALDFKRLIRLGFLERKGKGKASYYVLVDQVGV